MGEMSPIHWLIVIVVAILLFGAHRLPDAARSVGRSVRILKSELSGAHDDTRAAAGPDSDAAEPGSGKTPNAMDPAGTSPASAPPPPPPPP
jgi:sec-independent protein translocase protein TatA